MADIELAGTTYTVDDEGFLQDPSIWDDGVAAAFATTEGIAEMSAEHWAVVRCIRAYWQEHDSAPMVRRVCQDTGLTLRAIYKLFPSGPAKGACKVAGLPKPDGCV